MEGFQKVKHVVVDTGAFIKNAQIQTIGENVYTLTEVVSEIRDRATRERLQVLPYTLQFREPPVEAIKLVTDFSKKTGDFISLSAVDLKLIALTYQLEKEYVGTDHIRQMPHQKCELVTGRKLVENPAKIAGFYLDKKDKTTSNSSQTEDKDVHRENTTEVVLKPLEQLDLGDVDEEGKGQSSQGQISENPSSQGPALKGQSIKVHTEKETEHFVDKGSVNLSEDVCLKADIDTPCSGWRLDGDTLGEELLEEGEDSNEEDGSDGEEEDASDEEEEEDASDDDDDGGWITPGNIKAMKERLGDTNTEKATVTVGCLTTDFSMQNVMIQMGLNVVSVNGMLIKQAKSYALRCFACMKITSNLTKQFCPNCGNNTLRKVSMTVDHNGSVKYFLSRRKAVTTRGLRYSLPAPEGGKHGNNPILFEDQPCPQQRAAKKSQQNVNVFDPDYIANQSPFALNDTTSRAAQLGIRHTGAWNKRNPNVGRKKTGRRK